MGVFIDTFGITYSTNLGYPLEKLKSAIELSTVKIDVVLTYCKYTLNDIELLDYLPWFQEQGIGVINASPFAMGLLTDLGMQTFLGEHF